MKQNNKVLEQMDKTKELETKKIGQLLMMYALPAVISQIIASIYNIADRIFIGQGVGALAIAGLAITMPIMNIVHAFGALVGVGASARMSIVLGEKDIKWAENILGNSVILTLVFGFAVIIGGYAFMDNILTLFGATVETISYAKEYMMIVLPGMLFTMLTYNISGLIRASGYPTKSMLIMVFGAVLNMILDPIFIFVFNWGIAGAALATTISMASTAIISIVHFIDRKSFIRFRSHCWKPRFYIFKNILLIGSSPFLMNVAASGVVTILNSQLIKYGGDLAVGAYGIVNTICSLLVMLSIGVCQGMQPIAGYNYGAGHPDRLKEVFLLTMKTNLAIMTLGMIVGLVFPGILLRAFTTDAELIRIGTPAMRLIICLFPLVGFQITNSNFFQSIDKPWIAIVTSLARQVLFLAPLTLVIPPLFENMGLNGLNGVWISCTVSDVMGAILATILLVTQLKVFKRSRPEKRQ